MKNKASIIIVTAVFAGLLIFANSQGYLTDAFNATKIISVPFSLFFSNLSGKTSGFFSGIFQLGKIQKDNAQLKDQVNQLQAQIAQLAEDKKENESLKKLLDFKNSYNYTYESADVLAFDPSNIRGMITINKGEKNGLKAGMAVISDGFLAGRISEVSKDTAKVQLITDPTSGIPVSLQNSSTSGIAKGQIGSGLSMEQIPQGENIAQGDVVISSGLGGEIPKGLILGKINQITKKENSLFVTAGVRPSADLNNLSRLIIIKAQ